MSLEEIRKTANTEYKNYTFHQNNSGGVYIGPTEFVVTAASKEYAFALLKIQPWYTDVYCECCGPRWYETPDNEEAL